MDTENKMPDLETSLSEINALIKKMEEGKLTLEQSLTCFEKGIGLIKNAQKILHTTEQKIQILLKDDTTQAPHLKNFENDADDNSF